MIDIDKTIERYKEESKLYENEVVVYSHIMGFIHVLEMIKEQREKGLSVNIDVMNLDTFAEALEQLKEEKQELKEMVGMLEGEKEQLEIENENSQKENDCFVDKAIEEGTLPGKEKEMTTEQLVNELKERKGVRLEGGPAKILIVND